jgi:hypothetical protein
MNPVRLQLSRRKGFNLQAHSRAVNGLAAVNCARPGKWGNPFVVGQDGTAAECVKKYRSSIIGYDWDEFAGLRMSNLACWCPPSSACHADVLLELANPDAFR